MPTKALWYHDTSGRGSAEGVELPRNVVSENTIMPVISRVLLIAVNGSTSTLHSWSPTVYVGSSRIVK
jgi:hypothetical protein